MKLVELIFLLVIFTFTLGALGRIEVASDVALLLTDLLIPSLVLAWLGISLGVRRKVYLPPLFNLILIFILVCVLSLLFALKQFSRGEVLVSSLFLVRWVEYVFLYIIGYDLSKTLKDRELLYSNFLLFVSLLVALAGFLQLQIIPDFSQMAQEGGWDPHQGRVLSTFFDPNFVGGFFTLALILTATKLLYAKDRFWKLFLGLVWIIIFVALILTFSRSSYLAFVLAFGFLGLVKVKKLLPVLLVLVVISYFLIPQVSERINNLFEGDFSSQARITSWLTAFQIISQNPIIGVGFNTYRFAQAQYGLIDLGEVEKHSASGTDSSLLLVWATTGAIGLGVFVLLLGKMFMLSWRRRNSPSGLALLVSLVALLTHSQFVNSLFFPQIMGWFWVISALGLASNEKLS